MYSASFMKKILPYSFSYSSVLSSLHFKYLYVNITIVTALQTLLPYKKKSDVIFRFNVISLLWMHLFSFFVLFFPCLVDNVQVHPHIRNEFHG